jgi:aspartyl/asparaginyl beta-hydroxylase (cupin superfamily)
MAIWYSFKGRKYTTDRSPYYDLGGTDWYDKLQIDLPQILHELTAFLKLNDLDIQEYFNTTMVEGTRWEAVAFMFWKVRNEKMIVKGNKVFSYFKDIPGLVSLSVSILQPKTHIKGHYGDTDAIYRIHIPVYIPAHLPDCGITVGGISRPWVDNEMIVFCDACFHEAWNMTDKPRLIVIMDVIKKEHLPLTEEICANVLSGIKYQHFSLHFKFIKKFPGWMKDLVRRTLKLYPNNIFK